LLRPLGGKIYSDALDLRGEFTVMRAAYKAGVPVPRPYWFLHDLLGRPAALMQRLEGETIGRRIVKDAALAEARKCLPEQMGAALAAIHGIDFNQPGLREILPAPAPGQTPIQAQLEQCERDLDRIGEPHPAIELGLRWLRLHEPPPPERLVLVHGDFRIGNMLVTSHGLNGVLDWEFPHVGDPAEDLSWGLVREWRFGVDDLHFAGLGQPENFFAAYEEKTHSRVDPARIHYWEVLGNVRWAMGSLNQARRHLSGSEPNLEFASLGRRCAEMELEILRLIKD
jgi:aminoglycoside phosphotransferase (APT) family kinase protein